jgi:hypothetical protein
MPLHCSFGNAQPGGDLAIAQGRRGIMQLTNTPICHSCGSRAMGALNHLLASDRHSRRFRENGALLWCNRNGAADDDIDARSWQDVIWAISTRVDPRRDLVILDNTPIDYLDFASPVSGLGAKMGIDATSKWPGETARQWGRPIRMSDEVKKKIDAIWDSLGI